MDKYLIITGASRGIGKSTAELFQREGWQVVNISRNACQLKDVVNFSIDLMQVGWQEVYSDQLHTIIQSAKQLCVVHNASLYEHDDVMSLMSQRFREVLEVNLVAPTILNKLCIPYMREGSSILYVGSTLSEKAVKGTFSYTTTKHASIGMMRATCQDLAGTHIHTACICPGFTDTEMLHEHLPKDESVITAIKAMVTAGRFINPIEIAKVILFCAQNPVMNGAVVHANLGQIER